MQRGKANQFQEQEVTSLAPKCAVAVNNIWTAKHQKIADCENIILFSQSAIFWLVVYWQVTLSILREARSDKFQSKSLM